MEGIRGTLNIGHLKCCGGLVLEFLFRTEGNGNKRLSKEMVEGVWEMGRGAESVVEKGYAVG